MAVRGNKRLVSLHMDLFHLSFMLSSVYLPSFLPHLLEGISQFHITYLLRVLELQKAIPAMAC